MRGRCPPATRSLVVGATAPNAEAPSNRFLRVILVDPAVREMWSARGATDGCYKRNAAPLPMKYAVYGPCVTSTASPMSDDLSGDACEDCPERREEHTRSAGLAVSPCHGRQWIRGFTGGPGGADRSARFSPCPRLGCEPREPVPRSGAGGTSWRQTLRGLLRRLSWAQRGRHRQYSGASAWAGAECGGRRGFLVHHQRIPQRRDAVMGFAAPTAALAARHLSEDAGQCTRRGPGARCRTHDTDYCAASAGTVH